MLVWNFTQIEYQNIRISIYPRGGNYSREVIFAFLRIAKIAKFCANYIKLTPLTSEILCF